MALNMLQNVTGLGINMTVYVLADGVDIIGVYKTHQEALNIALREELDAWYVVERELKL